MVWAGLLRSRTRTTTCAGRPEKAKIFFFFLLDIRQRFANDSPTFRLRFQQRWQSLWASFFKGGDNVTERDLQPWQPAGLALQPWRFTSVRFGAHICT